MNMKKHILLTLSAICIFSVSLLADNPKREMRATWLTTVVNIDWPSAGVTSVNTQKKELTRMLDSIASLNMNTVFFHIRPAADALYHSKYEPWSSYLNYPRGQYPGYDPLQFCIEECHKRGLSCHGWINPYRYNNRATKGDWTGNNDTTQFNYKYTHPEWLLWYKNDIILDPGLPEVRQRIKEVIGDIINNYDIDGILMDDYFYPYGGTTTQDSETVTKYCPSGKAVGDWRRENVNKMIRDCYDTIQAVRPWMTFGVSPFGIWTTSTSVAAQRGYTLPSGISGGNMYAEIYCDPVAWLEEGTVDYISPQLYWIIGGDQDYKKLSQWWGSMCGRFGKHFYSSMALYRYADGNTGFTVEEIQNETQLNRTAVTDNAPGAVFYNTKAWVYDRPMRTALRASEFKYLALPPAINWKPAAERTMVSDLQLDGTTLTWSHPDEDVHFAIYAVPNAFRSRVGIFSKGDALLAIVYGHSYTLPANITPGSYKLAVSVLDGYNNEYALRVLGEDLVEPVATTLLAPNDGDARKLPFTFQWELVKKADSYIIQIARDAEFRDIVMTQEVVTNSFSTDQRNNLKYLDLGTYYWRVKTRQPNANDVWSAPRKVDFSVADGLPVAESVQRSHKFLHDGQLLIQADNATYTVLGQPMN